jgi:uncharacterized protein (TIGR03067 family)
MKKMTLLFMLALAALLAACASSAPEFRPQPPETDPALSGTWTIRSAELGGKSIPFPPNFELTVRGNRYTSGLKDAPPSATDVGKLVLFGDELEGQPRRLDVVNESGPNQTKRFPAIYRVISAREVEYCYDLAGRDRPREFVSPAGTMVFRVTYVRK